MGSELVSVVVPIYNVERYLEECVHSILKQTYHNLEIILVDDGSTDESGKICDALGKLDSRIQVIHKQNGGLSAARNTGIEAATGSYLVFIDSDDYIENQYVEKLYRSLEENRSDIAVCGYNRVSEDGKILFRAESMDEPELAVEKAMKYILDGEKINSCAWNKIYKNNLFHRIRYPEGQNYEDVATTYKVFLEAKRVSLIPDCLYFYRQREGSIVSDLKDYSGRLQLFRSKKQQIEDLSVYYKDAMDIGYSNLVMCYTTAIAAGARCTGIKKLKEMDECTDYVWAVSSPKRWKTLSNRQKIKVRMMRFCPKVLQFVFWAKWMIKKAMKKIKMMII